MCWLVFPHDFKCQWGDLTDPIGNETEKHRESLVPFVSDLYSQ